MSELKNEKVYCCFQ